jgi:hypothetical protein
MLSVITLNVVLLSVVMLSVFILSVTMLSVMAPECYIRLDLENLLRTNTPA